MRGYCLPRHTKHIPNQSSKLWRSLQRVPARSSTNEARPVCRIAAQTQHSARALTKSGVFAQGGPSTFQFLCRKPGGSLSIAFFSSSTPIH